MSLHALERYKLGEFEFGPDVFPAFPKPPGILSDLKSRTSRLTSLVADLEGDIAEHRAEVTRYEADSVQKRTELQVPLLEFDRALERGEASLVEVRELTTDAIAVREKIQAATKLAVENQALFSDATTRLVDVRERAIELQDTLRINEVVPQITSFFEQLVLFLIDLMSKAVRLDWAPCRSVSLLSG